MYKLFIPLLFSFLSTSSFAQATLYPNGLKTGDKAPLFKAQDNSGNTFNLEKQLAKGDVVLIFYRGQWCPYCNKELSHLNDSLALITAKGAMVVAVTPETNENVMKTVEKTKASFPIISDNNLSVMKLYNVNFAVDTATQAKYKKFGIDFGQANGSNGTTLPVPATYVIGKDGIIKYTFFNPDYRQRSSIQAIIDHLE